MKITFFSGYPKEGLFRGSVLLIRENPLIHIGSFFTFFTVILAVLFEKYIPGYGKYISIAIGICFGFLVYSVIKKRNHLSDKELSEKPMPIYLHVLFWILLIAIYSYAIWSLNN